MVKVILFLFLWSSTLLFGKATEGVMEVWGRDVALTVTPEKKVTPQKTLPIKVSQKMIRFFQVYISPIDGPRSSYSPTSSQYALQAIGKYGLLKGVVVGCDRLLRENGYHWVYKKEERGGTIKKIDPVR